MLANSLPVNVFVFCPNAASWSQILTKIARRFCYKSSGPFLNSRGSLSPLEKQRFEGPDHTKTYMKPVCFLWFRIRSNFNTREFNSRENYRFFGHNSEPCGNFGTILRQHLPIIPPDLPIPTRDLNSSVRPEFLNPKLLYKTDKSSRLLAVERLRCRTLRFCTVSEDFLLPDLRMQIL